MKRILLAGLLAGILIFVWSAVAHMFLGIGMAGTSILPNEDAVLADLRTNLPEAGLYFFPGWDMSREPTPEQEAAWMEKHRNGPAGLLVYKPRGGEAMPPSVFINELISNIVAALLAAFIAAALAGSFLKRALLLSLLGLFAWFSISVSYWIWYAFPLPFIVSEGIDVFVGALLAGFLIAKIVPAAVVQPQQ
jgi:hypothetical protein